MSAPYTDEQRALLCEVLDLGPDTSREVRLCEHDGKPNVIRALDAIAAFEVRAQAELLEALELLRSFGCPHCNGDCGSANPPVMTCPMQVASKAIAKARGAA